MPPSLARAWGDLPAWRKDSGRGSAAHSRSRASGRPRRSLYWCTRTPFPKSWVMPKYRASCTSSSSERSISSRTICGIQFWTRRWNTPAVSSACIQSGSQYPLCSGSDFPAIFCARELQPVCCRSMFHPPFDVLSAKPFAKTLENLGQEGHPFPPSPFGGRRSPARHAPDRRARIGNLFAHEEQIVFSHFYTLFHFKPINFFYFSPARPLTQAISHA